MRERERELLLNVLPDWCGGYYKTKSNCIGHQRCAGLEKTDQDRETERDTLRKREVQRETQRDTQRDTQRHTEIHRDYVRLRNSSNIVNDPYCPRYG